MVKAFQSGQSFLNRRNPRLVLRKVFFMRPVILILTLLGIGIITWLIVARPPKKVEVPSQQAIAVAKPTDSLNASIAAVITNYEKLSEQFVNWDSVATPTTAQALTKDFDEINLNTLKKDSSLYLTAVSFIDNAKSEAQTISGEKGIRPQREAFNSLTDNLTHLLTTIKYDREKLYLQECPMAFDDTQAAQWLSKKEEIRNPYLGLHHPKYGKGMLVCGETKQKLNYTGKE